MTEDNLYTASIVGERMRTVNKVFSKRFKIFLFDILTF